MSASLVGSEMCIRDRLCTKRSLLEGAVQGKTMPFGANSGLSADRPRPVSYTHLTLPTICSV
eukprot:5236541-Alexandrium_andersonii.AAC.1